MNTFGLIVMVCLVYVTSAADSSQCLSQYYTCLSAFGINATDLNPIPPAQELYSEHVMNRLCPQIGRFVGCYDTVMKCIQGDYSSPSVLSNADLTHLMETTCMHKSALISGYSCLNRIDFAQIQTGCVNQTQAMVTNLIIAGVSIEDVLCRSAKMSATCLFSSPALRSCGNDFITAMRLISDESSKVLCDKVTTTVSPASVTQDPDGILG
ncbi:uncharacterized protein LOC117342091 [Pecten maximus]|uniref:uncharacterized protein LOC117342091 n=1 Tax=Pecten maximus TaxID=6579 RepID=UPI0014584E6F|nr:uncharacterized protein LOC117342091 [Pecten maximus]